LIHNMLSELLSHLAKLEGWLTKSRWPSKPTENGMETVIAAVSNTVMSAVRLLFYFHVHRLSCFRSMQNVALRCPSYTYDSVQQELAYSAFPSHARQLALFALELLLDCNTLDAMPEIWQFHLNCDIPDLQSEFGKRMSTQLLFVCRHWIGLLREADSTDHEVISALSCCVSILRHWVVAMGILGETEQACRSLKALHVWLVRVETAMGTRDSPTFKDSKKRIIDVKQTVYDLYCWVTHSKNALATSSLSILGNGHPFIPSGSPLRRAFGTDMASQCQIAARHMSTNQARPPQVLEIKMSIDPKHAVFSPDGRHMATASNDSTLRVWDAGTGAPVRELKRPGAAVQDVAFSPDGRHIASASTGYAVRLWDMATGAQLRLFAGHSNALAFSPDGRYLATAPNDRTLRVWDVATGVSLRELRGHTNHVQGAAFSPDGRHLASASGDCTLRVWDVATGASLRVLTGHTGAVLSVAYSPDGHHLASASLDSVACIWDAASGASQRELRGHTDGVNSVAFSPDGRYLASASSDHTMRVWDAATGASLRVLRGHTGSVWSVAFSLDGRFVVSASGDCTVCVWDMAMGAPVQEFKGHTAAINSVTFSPDGRHVASTSDDFTVQVWDVADKCSIVHRVLEEPQHPREVSISPDGLSLMVQCSSGDPTHLCFPSLEPITDPSPLSTILSSATPSSPCVYLDQNCLCIRRQDTILGVCWLPDYFEPTTSVVQHGNQVCIGGKEGMIAFIDLDGLAIPDL
jgi:WD40 repeat protein